MPPRRVTFKLGQIIMDPKVLAALDKTGEILDPYLERYRHSDFGAISEEDKNLNNEALREGGLLFGIYQLKDRTQFIIETYSENENGVRDQTNVYLAED